jgi:carbon-monoxide dehydrogenase medium subunit
MKPAVFDYRAPETVQEALDALAEAPGDASLLAGGQSLVPLLNMRLARPTIVVDLNRVAALASVEVFDGHVRIGAMVRQRALETDKRICEPLPLLEEAARQIAHVPIRMRGTVGGSLAHADPAAELPAAMIALGARMRVAASGGKAWTLAADEFFVGPLTTALEPGTLLAGVEVDVPPHGTGWSFLEVARTHGAFALVGVAALLHLDDTGAIDLLRVALCGVGGRPYSPEWLAETAVGERPSDLLFTQIAHRVAESIRPHADGHAGREYRQSVARVLTARALQAASARAYRGAER